MAAHPLDPDTALRVRLNAYASRAANDSRPPAEVISELLQAAGGRLDLLAMELGLVSGSWRARSRLPRHHALARAFEALDLEGMEEWMALGFQRARDGGHNAEGFYSVPRK